MTKFSTYCTLILACLCISLAGCGIKPDHVDPPPQAEQKVYPRTYPDPATDPKPEAYDRKYPEREVGPQQVQPPPI